VNRYWQVNTLWPEGRRDGINFDTAREAEAFFNKEVESLRLSSKEGDPISIVWMFHDTSPGGTSGVIKRWERGKK
jgi:hypothetical protein